MRKLDVKEIHGYHADAGLRMLKSEARCAQNEVPRPNTRQRSRHDGDWLVETLRDNPEIAIFLTLGLGFWVGKLKFGSFSLGVVTSTLLAGVLVGQIDITFRRTSNRRSSSCSCSRSATASDRSSFAA